MLRRSLTAATVALSFAALTGASATPAQARPPAPWGSTPTKIVAIGDSFTAGFGYYADGDWMAATRLPWCKPGDVVNDACSSNSPTRENDVKGIYFSSDWGFGNQISWAANFAWSLGVRSETVGQYYRNFAVTGSTAKEWAEDKLQFPQYENRNALDVVAAEKPSIVLVTLGGNPTLSKVLFGSGNKCALPGVNTWQCFKELIAEDGTEAALETVYKRLLTTTDAIILPVVYPQVVPAATLFTAEELLVARNALNDSIVKTIDRVRADMPGQAWRLLWTHKDFNTGVTPGSFSEWKRCYGPTALGWPKVDGLSNQSVATQGVFAVTRKVFGWCSGPEWVISQDSGIHPNQEGYRQTRDAAVWRWENWPSATRDRSADDAPEPMLMYAKDMNLSARAGDREDIPIRLAFNGPRVEATLAVHRNIDCRKSAFRDNGKPLKYLVDSRCEPSEKVFEKRVTLSDEDHEVSIPTPDQAGRYTVIFRGGDLNDRADSVDANAFLRVYPAGPESSQRD